MRMHPSIITMKSLLFARLTHPVRDEIFLNIIFEVYLMKYLLDIMISLLYFVTKKDILDILKTIQTNALCNSTIMKWIYCQVRFFIHTTEKVLWVSTCDHLRRCILIYDSCVQVLGHKSYKCRFVPLSVSFPFDLVNVINTIQG